MVKVFLRQFTFQSRLRIFPYNFKVALFIRFFSNEFNNFFQDVDLKIRIQKLKNQENFLNDQVNPLNFSFDIQS